MPQPIEITSAAAPPPAGAYAQAVRHGELLFLAGQAPFDADGRIVDSSFAAQARQVFANLEAVAASAGGSLRLALRLTVYLTDLRFARELDEISREWIGDPRPARTTIQSDLRAHPALPGFDVEIDAIVALPS